MMLAHAPACAEEAGLPATGLNAGMAVRLFPAASGPLHIAGHEGTPPVWRVSGPSGLVGLIASTHDVVRSVGYSGRPIDILVGVAPSAVITGAALLRHNEPILTLGISEADIALYVGGFAGHDLATSRIESFADGSGLPPIIAGATVSTGVIRDAIVRTARAVALVHGFIAGRGARIDRATFAERTWSQLVADASISHLAMDLGEAGRRFGPIRDPLPAEGLPFIDLRVAVLDPPTIGRNLLGIRRYSQIAAGLGLDDGAILVAGTGVHSHRGTAYLQDGVFDRLELIQGERTIRLRKDWYSRIDKLAPADAPAFKEISVFRVPGDAGFVPSEPFRIEISAERERLDGSIAAIRTPLAYRLPASYLLSAPASAAPVEEPFWISAWKRKPVTIAIVGTMILWVTAAFFVQEFFVRRPRLWLWGRIGFLLVTLVFLGGIAKGQLSVVQVVAFLHALLNGFRWETFLVEPVIFILWAFLALGLLFWARGVYCGWLCPFGALQELLNRGVRWFGVPQIEVPFAVQERLWALKYTAFVGILGLSFYSMVWALVAAEIEPFKTALSMRFMRGWPFVLFAVGLLAAGLFIERFYCRYLCPLGAALAIPAKLKLFDWLHRRPQCGRECRFCETQCTVGAIDPIGRINPNECILCLKCQVIMQDDRQCTVLKQRARRGAPSQATPAPAPWPTVPGTPHGMNARSTD